MDRSIIGRECDVDSVFCEHRKALIDLAARIVSCRRKAEDIVHDVFVKYCEMNSKNAVRQPRDYLFGMVRNHAIDWVRRASLEQRVCGGSEEEGMQVPCALNCPEAALQRRQMLCALEAALNELPSRTRHVFELHRINGVPQKDIAKQLGVSPTLVNFMVKDALRACSTALTQME